MYIASAFAVLNSYIRRNRYDLYEQIEWSVLDFLDRDIEQIIDKINHENIDIFMVSVYVWNADKVFNTVKQIRSRCSPSLVIIAGGPSVDPHRDINFLQQHPSIDFAVYGQGEIALINILDNILGQKSLCQLASRNVSWRSDSGIKIATYEFVRDPHCSPIIDSKHLLEKVINNSEYKDYRKIFPYETSKGCPYKCSFCDWQSGLSHKVYHRKWSWREEIEVLGELGLTDLHIIDANFGMHKQDFDIARIFAEFKRQKGYDFRFHIIAWAKLNKQSAYEILEFMYQEKLYISPKFSVQDTNADVLANIDRPDIPWKEHKKIIDTLLHKYPELIPWTYVELIYGLPGQTRDSWKQTLLDTLDYGNRCYSWTMLPNSPGATKEYKDRMKIKTIWAACPVTGCLIEMIVETFSYNILDYCYFRLLALVVFSISVIQQPKDKKLILNFIETDDNLNATLEQMKNLLLAPDQTNGHQKISHCVNDFINSIIVKNRYDFDRNFIKSWVQFQAKNMKEQTFKRISQISTIPIIQKINHPLLLEKTSPNLAHIS